jgi:hypothetical protein
MSMKTNHTQSGKVIIDMTDYVKKMLKTSDIKFEGTEPTTAAED